MRFGRTKYLLLLPVYRAIGMDTAMGNSGTHAIWPSSADEQ